MPKVSPFKTIPSLLARFFSLLAETSGPLLPLVNFFALTTLILSTIRLGFVLWQWPRVTAVDGLWRVFVFGIRMDMILICYLLIPVALGLFLFPVQLNKNSIGQKISAAWLSFWVIFMVFMEAATPLLSCNMIFDPTEFLSNTSIIHGKYS